MISFYIFNLIIPKKIWKNLYTLKTNEDINDIQIR